MRFNRIQKLFGRAPSAAIRPSPRPRLRLEALEDRWCPSTLTVGSGHQYATIGAALTAANPNDTIDVYPGTYKEQVTIAKSGIKLVAQPTTSPSNVIITDPGVSPVTIGGTNIGGALVDITATNVKVTGFTINGTSNDTNLFEDVRVRNGGSATISSNTIVGPTTAPSNSIYGIGIQVGDSHITGTAAAGTAKINGNTISRYYAAGIVADGSGASASIGTAGGNTITGVGTATNPDPVAQYGVQVSNGATARVQGNTISGNTTTGYVSSGSNPAIVSAGIFFYNDGGKESVAALNMVSGNDDGILVQSSNGTCAGAIQVVNNDVHNNYAYAGIFGLSSNNILIANNDVSNNSTFNGIALNYSSNVLVECNAVYSNSSADGIYDYQGNGNQIWANSAYNDGNNGINIQSSQCDQLFNNTTSGNTYSGIQDLGGTNNAIWLGSSTCNVADGIILIGTNGDTVVGNVLALNGGYGLYLAGAKNTLIAFNFVVGNVDGSIYVDSTSTGTVQIANWTSTPPVMQGTTGWTGNSAAFTSSYADADAAVCGLDDV